MILSITLFIKLSKLSNSSITFYSYSPCNYRVMFFPSFFVPTSLLQSTPHFHTLHPSINLSFFKDFLFNKFLLPHHYTYKYIIQTYYCSLHKKMHTPKYIYIFSSITPKQYKILMHFISTQNCKPLQVLLFASYVKVN